MSDSENGAVISEAPAASSADVRDLAKQAAEAAMRNPDEAAAADTSLPEGKEIEAAEDPKKRGTAGEKANGKDPLKAAVVMRAREQARRIMEEAQQAKLAAAKDREEAQRLREAVAAEHQRLESFKKDPIGTLKASGTDPEWFTEQVLLQGAPDPVAKKLSPVQETVESLQKELGELREQFKRRSEYEQKVEADRAAQGFTQMVRAAEDKYPTLTAIYAEDASELVQKANQVAQEVYERTQSYPSWGDIAEYLEHLENQRYSRLIGRQKTDGNGKAPQDARAKDRNVRTLSGAAVSQKASAQIPFEKMNEMQQREFLKQQAELAMREFK